MEGSNLYMYTHSSEEQKEEKPIVVQQTLNICPHCSRILSTIPTGQANKKIQKWSVHYFLPHLYTVFQGKDEKNLVLFFFLLRKINPEYFDFLLSAFVSLVFIVS